LSSPVKGWAGSTRCHSCSEIQREKSRGPKVKTRSRVAAGARKPHAERVLRRVRGRAERGRRKRTKATSNVEPAAEAARATSGEAVSS